MKSFSRILLVSAVAIAIVGCGGNSASSLSPYVGFFAGGWNSLDSADAGVIAWTITTDGVITGTVSVPNRSRDEVAVPIFGNISNSGTFSVRPGGPTLGRGDNTTPDFVISGQIERGVQGVWKVYMLKTDSVGNQRLRADLSRGT
jgi:hypothetical protein